MAEGGARVSAAWRAGGVLLLLCAALTLAAQWRQQGSYSPTTDWEAAAAHVRARWSPGDGYRVVPPWDSRVRVFLREEAYIPAASPTWFDVKDHGRVWALWEAGREGEVQAGALSGWRPEGELGAFGAVRAQALVRQGEDGTAWDVFEALPRAEVWRVSGEKARRCEDFDAQERAWHCRPRDPWQYVGESLQTVTNDAHRCVWAMPVAEGRLEVRFAQVPGGTLRGYYGQPLEAVRSERGAPVRFAVEVDGALAWEARLGIHEEGFAELSVPLRGESQGVVFVVESSDKTDRYFCFAARVVRGGEAD